MAFAFVLLRTCEFTYAYLRMHFLLHTIPSIHSSKMVRGLLVCAYVFSWLLIHFAFLPLASRESHGSTIWAGRLLDILRITCLYKLMKHVDPKPGALQRHLWCFVSGARIGPRSAGVDAVAGRSHFDGG